MGEQYAGSTRVFSLQRMEELCQQGIDVESCDEDGKTFLRSACGDGNLDIVRFLLKKGADPNTRDKEGKTPLMAAAITGRLEVVKLLIEHGADPAVETPKGDSAIKMAQRWRKDEIARILLEKNEQGNRDQDTTPHKVVPPTSSVTNQQVVCAPVESIATQPIPERTQATLASQIGTLARIGACLLNPVHPMLHEVVRRIGHSEAPAPGETGGVSITGPVVDVTVTDTNLPTAQSNFTMPELTTDEYIQALQKMKESPDDRIGILGSLGATGLGAAAGGALVATLGTTTIVTTAALPVLGSATFGGWLGAAATTTAVVAAPATLVIGGAIAVAALGYGISRLIRSGAGADIIKQMNIKDLQAAIAERTAAAAKTEVVEDKFKGLVASLQLMVKNNRMDQSDCTDLLAGVEKGTISYDYAFGTIEKLLKE